MTVKVERCWGGSDKFYFRLSWDSHWQHITGDTWTRKIASTALDILESCYGLVRQSVRFEHH